MDEPDSGIERPEVEALRRAWLSAPPEPDLQSFIHFDAKAQPLRLAALVRFDALERRRCGMAWTLDHYKSVLRELTEPGSPIAQLLIGMEIGLIGADPDALKARVGAQYSTDIDRAVCSSVGEQGLGGAASGSKSGTNLPPTGVGACPDDQEPASWADGSVHHEGERIGPYTILSVLGEGGMGVVYLAQQSEPVARRVALKVIKPGMDSKSVLARFKAERQALAMMDHPSVAKVYDTGVTDRGRPYFAMEWVEGLPITDHCDRHKLLLNQRIELFIQVCHAVQHAHQKGVIHRDLKPSNILVEYTDTKTIPKIIDFGVAKALNQKLTEATLFTEQGQLVGTPEYMSPEQAEMSAQGIDTRSDIYSLGVLLYELLTGALPFERGTLRKAALGEIQRLIREVDPPKPSTRLSSLEDDRSTTAAHSRRTETRSLSRQLRGDLDWIVMKALEKDRARRYDTANSLAADIQRHLNNEPVLAGPPSAAYRVRKFSRRHRPLVISVASVLTVLLLGAATTSWQAIAASQARDRAAIRDREGRKLATDLLNDIYTEVSHLRASTHARSLIVDAAFSYLDQLAATSQRDPALQSEVAAGYERLGDILGLSLVGNSGDTKAAMRSYTAAFELRQQLVKESPSDAQRLQALARVDEALCRVYRQAGDADEAFAWCVKALQTRRTLARQNPADEDRQGALATSLIDSAGLLKQAHDYDGAEEQFIEALAIRRRIAQRHPTDLESQRSLSVVLLRLSNLAVGRYLVDDAVRYSDQMLAIRQRLASAYPDNAVDQRNLMFGLYFAADASLLASNPDEAVDRLTEAERIATTRRTEDAENAAAVRDMYIISSRLGDALLYDVADYERAVHVNQRVVSLAQLAHEMDPANAKAASELGNRLAELAHAQLKLEQIAKAVSSYKRAVKILRPLADAEPNNHNLGHSFARALAGLGASLREADNTLAAKTALTEALKRFDRLNASTSQDAFLRMDYAEALLEYAEVLATAGDFASAEDSARGAVNALESLSGDIAADLLERARSASNRFSELGKNAVTG